MYFVIQHDLVRDAINHRILGPWRSAWSKDPGPCLAQDMLRIDVAPVAQDDSLFARERCIRVDLSTPGSLPGKYEWAQRQLWIYHDTTPSGYALAYRFARLAIQYFRVLYPHDG